MIAQDGAPRDLYDAPADAFVADFIGEANILPCEIVSVDGGKARVKLGDITLSLPARGNAVGPASLAVRPSRIVLGDPGAKGSLRGRIAKATYVGSHMEYVVDLPTGPIFVVTPEVDTPLAAGQDIAVQFSASGPVLIS